ncbi:MAG: endonuclease domain-containing protein, partial [Acidimicrobiia bacterium]|nr:endonuclease domain-containing protein [Acidimicrobiia bacterium]
MVPRLPRREYSTRLSRALRKSLTPEEARLWTVLRHDFSAKFRRQEPLGPYIVDFVCYEHRLIIEVDGVQHAESEADQRRDAYLARLGFRVLRVWNGEVLFELAHVTDWIESELSADRRVTQATHRRPRRSPGIASDGETPSVAAEDGGEFLPLR